AARSKRSEPSIMARLSSEKLAMLKKVFTDDRNISESGQIVPQTMRHILRRDQNPNRRRKRKVRPSFSVLVICPKFGAVRFRPGSANCGVWERLIASARMVMFQSRGRVQVRPNEAFKFAILPFRKVLRPRLPAIPTGARMKRK